MKVAILGSRGIPASYSGVERAVEEVSRRLVLKGHEVTVYCRRGEYSGKEYQGVKLIYLSTVRSKNFGTFIHVLLGTLIVMLGKADLVHYHALGPSFFAFFPRIFGKKIIVTIHGLDWQRKKWGIVARVFLKYCQYSALYFPHQTIVVSSALKEYFEQKFRKRVHYIPNGAGPVVRTEAHGLKKEQYILFVGRLVPEKGVQYLIQAFNEIRTDFSLVLAGESSFTDKYVRSLKQMAGQRIRFLGFVSGPELELLYKNAYIVVLPSELEGSPLVLLEAMNYGKCVLASDLSECREILKECGVYFKAQDSNDLKEKLQYLLGEPKLIREYGEKARELAQRSYNWDRITEETEKIYLM